MVPTLRIPDMWRSHYSSVIALVFLLAVGCRTAIVDPPGQSTVHTTIVGRVTNDAGGALAGVTVTSGSQSATTDENGLFFLANVSTNAEHAFVIAKKAGYFNGARTAQAVANGTTYMQIGMVPQVLVGTIDGTTGGTVATASGAKLTLDGGSVVTSSGAPYTGEVSVFAAHLSPSDARFAYRFPGDLSATTADGKPTILRSFGVMIAELRGASGETLEPASGKPAHMTVPIPASLQSAATSTIPLWYFDETTGLWKEEGWATLAGNAFKGDVAHFTAWNCDYQGPWGELHGRVVCANGLPVPGIVVSLGQLSTGGLPMVTTDQHGEFRAKVPANWDKLEYQILAGNNAGLFYTNAPVRVTVETNTTKELGDISLDSPCPVYLAGTLRDCDGKLTAGMIIAKWTGGGIAYTYTTDGNYRMIAATGATVTLAATSALGSVAQPRTISTGGAGSDYTAPDLIACQETSESFIDIKGTYNYSQFVFSPDGSKLAAQEGKDMVLYGAPSWTEVGRISLPGLNDSLHAAVFSPDGSKLLLSTSSRAQVEVWSVNGTKITTNPIPIYNGIFSQDGNSVLGIVSGSLVTYDLLGNATSSVPLAASAVYTIMGRAADGSLVAPGSQKTYLIDPATGAIKSQFPTSLYVWSSKVSANGHVFGGWSTGLHFYSLATGTELTPAAGVSSGYSAFDIAPDDISFVEAVNTQGASSVGFYAMADGTPQHLLEVDQSAGSPSALAITADGKHVAALYSTSIRIWTLK